MGLSKTSVTKLLGIALKGLPALFFVVALWILIGEAGRISGGHLWAQLGAIAPRQWAAALLATAFGYATLTLYDVIGLRVMGQKLPYRAAAEGAFLSFTLSNNVGFSWISGGSMRQRVYGPLRVPLAAVARLTVFNSVTFFIGAFLLLGAILIGEPGILSPLLPISATTVRVAGAGCWLLIIGYLLLCEFRRRPVGWRRLSLPVPAPVTAVAQIVLSSVDIGLAGLALYLLLPAGFHVSFYWLLGVYVVALSGSVLTHVPGGLGVLEALILWGLPDAPRAPLFAALIAYRIVYYLVPLAAALLLLAGRTLGKRGFRAVGQGVPLLAAALSLLSGTLLLFAGATPALDAKLDFLRAFVPLPLLELSHLAGSIAGLALVVLANALYRRYDTARQLSIVLLLGGAVATMLSGAGLLQALLLAGAALVVELSGAAFYRRGSLWRNAISPKWLILSLCIVGISIMIGLAAYANVNYRNELWWQFAYQANAPRFLRASLVVSALAFGLLIARLTGPSRAKHFAEMPDDAIHAAVAASPDTGAGLALLGDKRFLRSASGRSFLMYQVEGRSWIAMGGPVGPASEGPELVWRFRELADLAGGRPVFYEVPGNHLDLYADAGLVAHKVGEEARVDLAGFTLERPAAKSFRAALRRGERAGLSFEIIAADEVVSVVGELKSVSDEWLKLKRASEKGFSMGAFDPRYLSEFDCAVVRHEGQIVAFANLWFGAGLEEASMDLMRHRADAPHGTMMFLMLNLMLWARQSGFAWFNLGMAPLAGLSPHRLAPKWHLVGRVVFNHGERLYGFGGLRRFKAQFSPVWRPRYIACRPGIVPLALALADCLRLISRPIEARPVELTGPAGRLGAVTLHQVLPAELAVSTP